MARAVDIIAAQGVQNADAIVRAAVSVGLEVAIAAAIIQKESNGRNVYGHDRGGVFSTAALGKPHDNLVTEQNFADFRRRIDRPGAISNGVGPAQITWDGYFPDAERKGYKLWQAEDNIRYGLNLFASHLRGSGDIVEAGRAYNGARQYGVDLANMVSGWRDRLAGASLDIPATPEPGVLSALDDGRQEHVAAEVSAIRASQVHPEGYSMDAAILVIFETLRNRYKAASE